MELDYNRGARGTITDSYASKNHYLELFCIISVFWTQDLLCLLYLESIMKYVGCMVAIYWKLYWFSHSSDLYSWVSKRNKSTLSDYANRQLSLARIFERKNNSLYQMRQASVNVQWDGVNWQSFVATHREWSGRKWWAHQSGPQRQRMERQQQTQVCEAPKWSHTDNDALFFIKRSVLAHGPLTVPVLFVVSVPKEH